jgi:hypothetical protein
VGRLKVRAVLLDALGTLLRLEDPVPPLREQLAARCDLDVDRETAEAALAAEIAYYRAHNLEGADRAALADLRRRCALVLRDALGPRPARRGSMTCSPPCWRRCASRRTRTSCPRSSGCAPSGSGSWSYRTGTSRCMIASPRRGSRSACTA